VMVIMAGSAWLAKAMRSSLAGIGSSNSLNLCGCGTLWERRLGSMKLKVMRYTSSLLCRRYRRILRSIDIGVLHSLLAN
jgi:hypothetical protein